MMNILKNVEWVLPLRSEFLTPFMECFAFLGNDLFLFYSLSLGFWIWRKESFRHLIILNFIGFIVNLFLKNIVQDPRPDIKYHLIEAYGYGFPSGHAQIAISFWIALALEINRPMAWLTFGLVAFGLGFSRIYLGVHDLDDVIWGYLIAGMILFIFYRSKAALYKWGMQLSLPIQLLMPWILAALLILIYPASIEPYLVYSCCLLGAQSTGLILESHFVRFSNPDSLGKRITAGLLGLIIISSIVYTYKNYDLGMQTSPYFVLFLYIIILSLWQTFFLPYLFVNLKLSKKLVE